MSYKTLQNIYDDFTLAASETEGINSFYMLDDISEINTKHSLTAPVCIVETPDSSIPNINRAREEYELSCYMLKARSKQLSDSYQIRYYDDMVNLFSEWVSEIMKQRDGLYTVDRESFQIERVRNVGSANLMGVNVTFTLLAPSNLLFYTEDVEVAPSYSITSGLYAFFNGGENLVVSSSSLTWTSALHDGSAKVISLDSGASSVVMPTYNSPTLSFDSSSSLLKLSNLTFSTANWTVFLRLSVDSATQADKQVLFRITDPSSGDGFIFGLNTHGGTTDEHLAIDGQPYFKLEEDSDVSDGVDAVQGNTINTFFNTQTSYSSPDLEPFSDGVIAIVNNATDGKVEISFPTVDDNGDAVRVHIKKSVEGGNLANEAQFTGANMWFAGSKLEEWNFNNKPFIGDITHIAIYDGVVSESDCATVANEMMAING